MIIPIFAVAGLAYLVWNAMPKQPIEAPSSTSTETKNKYGKTKPTL